MALPTQLPGGRQCTMAPVARATRKPPFTTAAVKPRSSPLSSVLREPSDPRPHRPAEGHVPASDPAGLMTRGRTAGATLARAIPRRSALRPPDSASPPARARTACPSRPPGCRRRSRRCSRCASMASQPAGHRPAALRRSARSIHGALRRFRRSAPAAMFEPGRDSRKTASGRRAIPPDRDARRCRQSSHRRRRSPRRAGASALRAPRTGPRDHRGRCERDDH